MNKNTEYEKFAQEIYQELANSQGITTEVKHNIKLTGKSGQKHQIDVYWEYTKDGIQHNVIIECKNYKKEVSIGKVRDFSGLLCDLENVSGIMITKVGYQKGAKKYADYYGINLKELRAPNGEECIIGKTHVDITVGIRRVLFLPDEEWCKVNNVNTSQLKDFLLFFSQPDDTWIEDGYLPLSIIGKDIVNESGKSIKTFDELEKNLPESSEYTYNFENAYVNSRNLGKVKIRAVKYINIKEEKDIDISIDARDITKAILKDAINGEIVFFMKKDIDYQ